MANEYSILIKAQLDDSSIKKLKSELEGLSKTASEIKIKVNKSSISGIGKEIKSQLKSIEVPSNIKLKPTVNKSTINSIQKDIRAGLKNIEVPVNIKLKPKVNKAGISSITNSVKSSLKSVTVPVKTTSKGTAASASSLASSTAKVTSAVDKQISAINKLATTVTKITAPIKSSTTGAVRGVVQTRNKYDNVVQRYSNQDLSAISKRADYRLSNLIPTKGMSSDIQSRFNEAYKLLTEFNNLKNQVSSSISQGNQGAAIAQFDQAINKGKELDNVLKMLKTDYDTYMSSQGSQAKSLQSSFNSLLSTAKQISALKVQQSNLLLGGKTNEANSLNSQIGTLTSQYRTLFNANKNNLSIAQRENLTSVFQNATNKINARQADAVAKIKLKVDSGDIDKQIGSVRSKISNLENSFSKFKTGKLIDTKSFTDMNNSINVAKTSLGQLENVSAKLKTSLATSTDTTAAINGFNNYNIALKQVSASINDASSAVAKVNNLKASLQEINSVMNGFSTGKFTAARTSLSTALSKLNQNDFTKNNPNYAAAIDQYNKVLAAEQKMKSAASSATSSNSASVNAATAAIKEYNAALDTARNKVTSLEVVQRQLASSATAAQEAANLSMRISGWMKNNTAAEKEFGASLRNVQAQLKSADAVQLRGLRQQFYGIQQQAIEAGKAAQSFGTRVSQSLKTMVAYTGLNNMFFYARSMFSGMVKNVENVDSAMTELKKVTDETSDTYGNFESEAYKTSQKIGTTQSDFINSTANFARLGYSMKDAAGLAEQANIYYSVGDGLDSIDQATTNLISTLSAFKSAGQDTVVTAKNIVDVLDNVSNKEAISSGGLGDILSRGGSSMAAAGNTLEETVALGVGMNQTVQNPASVGNGLKTNNIVFVYRNVHNRTHLIAGKA